MDKSARLAIIVLAAGAATRFKAGDPSPTAHKLLAPWRGEPLLRPAAKLALALPAKQRFLVTGADAAAISQAIADLSLPVIHNADYAAGMASSLRKAIEALSPQIEAALILLADMPDVRLATALRLIDCFNPTDQHLLAYVPIFEQQWGNPVLLTRKAFSLVMKLSGDQGARALLRKTPACVKLLETNDPAILTDIDTKEDLIQATKKNIGVPE